MAGRSPGTAGSLDAGIFGNGGQVPSPGAGRGEGAPSAEGAGISDLAQGCAFMALEDALRVGFAVHPD